MKHACMYMDPTGRYLVPIKISVKNKTVLIQRMALYPATATCIASAPLVPEPSSYSDFSAKDRQHFLGRNVP